MLKFSGTALTSNTFPTIDQISWLGDAGPGVGAPTNFPPSYPVSIPRTLQNLSTNLLPAGFLLTSGTIRLELFKNLGQLSQTILATVLYDSVVHPGGIQNVPFVPTPVGLNDTIDIQVTTRGLGEVVGNAGINLSATVGIE